MKKLLLVVVLGLSSLAGCAADATDEGAIDDSGRRSPDKLVLVNGDTPVVLPAEEIDRSKLTIAGRVDRQGVTIEAMPEIWQIEGIDLPIEPRANSIPCQGCVPVDNGLHR